VGSAQTSFVHATFLTGGGGAGDLMRARDWAATPLGPAQGWPQPLKTLVGVMLGSNQPMFVAWGSDRTLLYNGPYAQILGNKHPFALGRDFLQVWHEARNDLLPMVEEAYAGRPVHMDNIKLVLERKGYPEEAHFVFSYTPVRGEDGAVAGFFCPCVEITEQVRAERRLAEERERQQRMLQQMPGFAAMLSSPEHRFEYVNDAYREIAGQREFLGRTVREVFPDVAGQGFYELLDRVYATGEPFAARAMPVSLADSDGKRFIDLVHEPIRDEAGHVTGIFVGGYDVTERYRAEAALRESEARLGFLDQLGAETAGLADADAILATSTRLLGEHLSLSVCAYADMDEDQDGFTIRGDWAAPGLTSIVGHYSLADFGKLAVTNLSAGLPLVVNDNLHELAPEEAATFQNIGIAATICMPLVKEGRLTALMAIHDRLPRVWTEAELSLLREVTTRSWAHVERVATAAELRASEARFRLTADAVPQIVWITDAEGRVEFFNKQWFDYTGVSDEPTTAAEVAARHVHPEDQPATMAAFNEAHRTSTTYTIEHRIRSAAGDYRWFLVRGEPYRDSRTCEIVRWFGASVDIHDRRQAEIALRESESRFREIADAAPVLIWISDINKACTWFNRPWLDFTGRTMEQEHGFGWAEGVHPDDYDRCVAIYSEAFDRREPFRMDYRLRRHDGEWRIFDDSGVPRFTDDGVFLGYIGACTDVTEARGAEQAMRELNDTLEQRVAERTVELEQAQEALRQSQKLEAMGQLTGGVAHDFNNLLTPIIGSLDMLIRRGVGSERERRLIDGALQSAERAKTLVQRLLAFARRQPLQPSAVDVKRLVGGMAELIASTSGPKVDVRVELPDDLPPAVADANQLEMAVLNLAVNARDAMPDGGVLTILAAHEAVRPGHHSKLRQGHYVRLSVKDTGVGMDEATLTRAIEPFFSTKGIGKGTGLGLSMVHGLALQLNGGLMIMSRPGEGTTIDLWLPISSDTADAGDRNSEAVPAPKLLGTALLVDDEDLVRMSTADMLIDLGFEVVEASSAEEAIRLIAEGLAPDLLVTDHLMPGLSGAELARDLRLKRPDLRVLIVSGYAEVEGIAHDLPRLTKPFRSADLAASLAV
jgi:PAS domain S-box-containing protein